jgi:hypothetical protein
MRKRHIHKITPKAGYGELTKLNKFVCMCVLAVGVMCDP